jgi:uncharacterized protein YqeY
VQPTARSRERSGGQPTDPRELRDRLRADLLVARKARQADTVTALRTTLAALDNAEAVAVENVTDTLAAFPVAGAGPGVGSTEVARRILSIEDIRTILAAQVAERLAAASDYDAYGQAEAARRLRREASALERYLETT